MKIHNLSTFKDKPYLTKVVVKDGKVISKRTRRCKSFGLYRLPHNSIYCKRIERKYNYRKRGLVGMMFTKKDIKENELPLRYEYPDFEKLLLSGYPTYGEPCGYGFPFVFNAVLSNILNKVKKWTGVKKKPNYTLLGYSYALIVEQDETPERHSWIITLELQKRNNKTGELIGEPFYNIGVITDIFNKGASIQAEFGAPRISFIKPRKREDLDYLPTEKRKKYKKAE